MKLLLFTLLSLCLFMACTPEEEEKDEQNSVVYSSDLGDALSKEKELSDDDKALIVEACSALTYQASLYYPKNRYTEETQNTVSAYFQRRPCNGVDIQDNIQLKLRTGGAWVVTGSVSSFIANYPFEEFFSKDEGHFEEICDEVEDDLNFSNTIKVELDKKIRYSVSRPNGVDSGFVEVHLYEAEENESEVYVITSSERIIFDTRASSETTGLSILREMPKSCTGSFDNDLERNCQTLTDDFSCPRYF